MSAQSTVRVPQPKRKLPKSIKINLMPMDPFYDTPAGRVLSWASNVGRYLVIFTEIVVIMSFASRFTLDRQLTDLNTSILQQSYLVESFSEVEQTTRVVQKKTEFLKQKENNSNPIAVLDLLRNSLPRSVFITNANIKTNEISVTGETELAESLSSLVAFLARKPEVEALYVNSVTNRKNGLPGFEFSLRIVVQQGLK